MTLECNLRTGAGHRDVCPVSSNIVVHMARTRAHDAPNDVASYLLAVALRASSSLYRPGNLATNRFDRLSYLQLNHGSSAKRYETYSMRSFRLLSARPAPWQLAVGTREGRRVHATARRGAVNKRVEINVKDRATSGRHSLHKT
jgi:hypothetical protein